MTRTATCSLCAIYLFTSMLQIINAAQMNMTANATGNPLQNTVTMLEGMYTTSEALMKEENVQMVAEAGNCENQQAFLTRSNRRLQEEVNLQTAKKGQAEQEVRRREEAITYLTGKIMETTDALEAGQTKRNLDAADAHITIGDLMSAVDGLKSAIQALDAVKNDVAQASSLIQVMSSGKLSEDNKALIESFMKMSTGQPNPEAYGYESQTGAVMAHLQKLLIKFQDERNDAQKKEMNVKFAWERMKLNLENANTMYDNARSKREQEKSEWEVKLGEATSALNAASTSLATGKQDLETEVTRCKLTAEEFKKNQQIRSQELALFKETVRILGKVGNFKPPEWSSFLSSPKALVQVYRSGTESNAEQLLRRQVVDYMRERSTTLKSQPLSLLVTRLQNDPIQVAKRLVKDLMMKMISEANIHDDEKAYCDREMNANALTRTNAQEVIENRIALVEEEQAKIMECAGKIEILNGEIKQQYEDLRTERNQRKAEKKSNDEVMADAKQSQYQVERAISGLQNFYSQFSLVQMQSRERSEEQSTGQTEGQTEDQSDDSNALTRAMETRSGEKAPYEGHDAASQVITLLDEIMQQYAKLETDTRNMENEQQAAYDTWFTEHDRLMAIKHQEWQAETDKKYNHEGEERKKKEDLALAQETLEAALRVYARIKPMCEDMQDWQSRIVSRNLEIQACQKALNMLDEDYNKQDYQMTWKNEGRSA